MEKNLWSQMTKARERFTTTKATFHLINLNLLKGTLKSPFFYGNSQIKLATLSSLPDPVKIDSVSKKPHKLKLIYELVRVSWFLVLGLSWNISG